MKKFREFLSKPVVTVVLFALALLLLGSSTVGGARAALNIQSEYYNSEVEVYNIGVALLEKQADGEYSMVSGKDGLMGADSEIQAEIAKDGGKLLVNRVYPEVLAVRNNADIHEYVRVSVYKYWMTQDADGNWVKTPEMDSKWIHLNFVEGDGWTIDDTPGSTTEERTILYYAERLDPNGGETTPFLESISIDKDAIRQVTESQTTVGNTTIIEWEYVYNGNRFCIEVLVDGVQDHNVDQAKLSAWGVNDK
jgi:hypothetical protein